MRTPQYKSRFLLKNERKKAFVLSGSNYFNVDCFGDYRFPASEIG
jgi:hypothetical protein